MHKRAPDVHTTAVLCRRDKRQYEGGRTDEQNDTGADRHWDRMTLKVEVGARTALLCYEKCSIVMREVPFRGSGVDFL